MASKLKPGFTPFPHPFFKLFSLLWSVLAASRQVYPPHLIGSGQSSEYRSKRRSTALGYSSGPVWAGSSPPAFRSCGMKGRLLWSPLDPSAQLTLDPGSWNPSVLPCWWLSQPQAFAGMPFLFLSRGLFIILQNPVSVLLPWGLPCF